MLCRMIYLDYNATTPLIKEVKAEMEPFLDLYFGNPSSPHAYGMTSKQALEAARRRIADSIACHPDEIIFTSGGTEANNLAIIGVTSARRNYGNRIVTSSIEHPSVIETAKYIEKHGIAAVILEPDHTGRIEPSKIKDAITPRTILVSIQIANNEIGTIQPIAEIAEICRQKKVLLHADAVQALGKINVSVAELGVDLLTISSHKVYGPKGVGALYLRKGIDIDSLLHGGGQEDKRRAGTENVSGIVGFGKACEIAVSNLKENSEKFLALRDRFEELIITGGIEARINGNPFHRLPNTSSISFKGISSERLIRKLSNELAISAASACSTCNPDEWRSSHVLEALKVSKDWSLGTIRISVGVPTSQSEVETAAQLIENYLNTEIFK